MGKHRIGDEGKGKKKERKEVGFKGGEKGREKEGKNSVFMGEKENKGKGKDFK